MTWRTIPNAAAEHERRTRPVLSWYRYSITQWRAHVRGLPTAELAPLRACIEEAVAACRSRGATKAADVNARKARIVRIEIDERAGAPVYRAARERYERARFSG